MQQLLVGVTETKPQMWAEFKLCKFPRFIITLYSVCVCVVLVCTCMNWSFLSLPSNRMRKASGCSDSAPVVTWRQEKFASAGLLCTKTLPLLNRDIQEGCCVSFLATPHQLWFLWVCMFSPRHMRLELGNQHWQHNTTQVLGLKTDSFVQFLTS